MGTYRVYRVGEDEAVREARAASPKRLRKATATAGRQSSDLRALLIWAAVAAACAAVAALFWFYGRDMFGNSQAAFDLAKLSGKVPGWAFYGVPVIAAVIVAVAAVYLAFGRYLALKLVGVAVVIAVLAAPGLALGWANGTVNVVSHRSAAVQKVVKETTKELRPALPGKAQNILLIGSDKSDVIGDPGRSDTQMLIRLDPETKSISMLSLPRDLRVLIPDHGYDKMNTAYSYGGPPLVVKTFKQITGLPINHFVEVDFAGFWHVVNILGGVYIPVDHKYFVPASADYKSINLDAGYQLVRGKQALNFVRFRHDQLGDFTRMQRQQLFLKELQRQSGRWSGDWQKVLKLIKAITDETTSDIDSLKRLEPLVELVFEVDTSKINTVHLEGDTPMIDGVSYVTATQEQIDAAVGEFASPTQAPVKDTTPKISKKLFRVTVYNGSGIAGLSTDCRQPAGRPGVQGRGRPRRPVVPGHHDHGVRAPASGAVGEGDRGDVHPIGGAARRTGSGRGRRHRGHGHVVVRRHRSTSRRRRRSSHSRLWRRTSGTTRPRGRRWQRRRRCAWRCPPPGRAAPCTTSSASTASPTSKARARARPSPWRGRPWAATGASRPMRWTRSAGHRGPERRPDHQGSEVHAVLPG